MIQPVFEPVADIVSRATAYLRYRYHRFDRDSSVHPVRRRRQKAAEEAARAYFESDPSRRHLVDLFEKSRSTGAGWSDYHLLHRYVMTRRPGRILEFGSGVTTLVMAAAINEAGLKGAHLWSLEDIPRFHDDVRSLIPDALAAQVTLVCSEKMEDSWRNEIWGFHYRDLPPGPFDFVFVDGPTEYRGTVDAGLSGAKGACLDLLYLLARDPDVELDVVVDQKFSSLDAYQSVLPAGAVRYDPVLDVGVLAGINGRLVGPRRMHPRVRKGRAARLLRMAGR